MIKKKYLNILIVILISFSCTSKKKLDIKESVEVLRDNYGINHIYANNQNDLFFMQGYLSARDRLFQFEIWRRQATGTVAEIFGDDELERDIGTRLFKFRGNMVDELNHYHEDGFEIVSSFVSGINKYIEEVNKEPNLLPIEFDILGIKPEKWTNEDVISRHQGLLGNIEQELNIGRAVSLIGEEKVKELMWFHPKDPDIKLGNDDKIRWNSDDVYIAGTTSSDNIDFVAGGNSVFNVGQNDIDMKIPVNVDDSTQSTTKTTGCMIIDGGVGIAKTLNVGEDVVAYASSDERYKDLITPIENPNEKIKLLSGNTFTWNDKHEVFKGKKDIGVIAQEVEKVLPEIVETRDNGYKAVKYEKIVALLIESNKELLKRVEELESKIK